MAFQLSRVAVIGGGVSGLTTARHLKTNGVDVLLYERSGNVGGNWLYDERKSLEPNYPSVKPSIADFVAKDVANEQIDPSGIQGFAEKEEEVALKHAPPGPAYYGLTNNIPTPLQTLKGYPWKEGTGDHVNVRVNGDYLRGYWNHFRLEPVTKLNTRVEKLEKIGGKWRLESSTLVREGPEKGSKIKETEEFDGIVVASGHYHAANVPDIPGLSEWKATWPDRVQHSKSYRRPEGFKDQNVLLIGGGVSSTDIAREITPYAHQIYQSSRNGLDDLPPQFLPSATKRVTEIASFSLPTSSHAKPGSSTITLTDGTVLNEIDRVVICTGYHITYPFLTGLHADDVAAKMADARVLVTDGTVVHNLHRDIFYIPDPTLAFVGVPYHVATFSLFEFQAIAAAAVFSGRALLPGEEEMRKEYLDRVQEKGVGRALHSLKGKEVEYVKQLVTWLNKDAEVTGAEKVEGHSREWLEEDKFKFEKLLRHFEVKEEDLELLLQKFLGARNAVVETEKQPLEKSAEAVLVA